MKEGMLGRLIDADAMYERFVKIPQGLDGIYDTTDLPDMLGDMPTITAEPVIHAVWHYYTNDEGKARWRCTNCGKLCHKNPHDKQRCSVCGARMRMEA